MSVRRESEPLPVLTPVSAHNRALGGLFQLRDGLGQIPMFNQIRKDATVLDMYARMLDAIEKHLLDDRAVTYGYRPCG